VEDTRHAFHAYALSLKGLLLIIIIIIQTSSRTVNASGAFAASIAVWRDKAKCDRSLEEHKRQMENRAANEAMRQVLQLI
jgi:hypothetical protein